MATRILYSTKTGDAPSVQFPLPIVKKFPHVMATSVKVAAVKVAVK